MSQKPTLAEVMAMEPKEVLRRLHLEISEHEVARRLRAMGVNTSAPTLNRIRKGGIKHTRHEIGAGVAQIYLEVLRGQKPKNRDS